MCMRVGKREMEGAGIKCYFAFFTLPSLFLLLTFKHKRIFYYNSCFALRTKLIEAKATTAAAAVYYVEKNMRRIKNK